MSCLRTPIRRAIRRRPSPGLGSMGLPAVTVARGSAAAMEQAWERVRVRVRVRQGDWPEAGASSARAAAPRCRWSHRRWPAGSSRRLGPLERVLNEMWR
jgi:hypothetical protein